MDSPSSIVLTSSQEEAYLSPNAKIQKMLAYIDEQFDNQNPENNGTNTGEAQPTSNKQQQEAASLAPPEQRSPSLRARDGPFQQDSDTESDDSDAIRVPRGKAARRLFTQRNGSPGIEDRSPSRESRPELEQNPAPMTEDDDLYSVTPVKRTRRTRTASPTPVENDSSTLFVSPSKSTGDSDQDELPDHPVGSSARLKKIIAEKRAERLAREAEEANRRHEAMSSDLPSGDLDDSDSNSPDAAADPEVERIMSDATRPVRKASKKAILEMERETQRLARQQALAHQMKTKKKFTTQDLMARFNFRQPSISTVTAGFEKPIANSTPSSALNSDATEPPSTHPASTPPSSPPTPWDKQKALVDSGALDKLVPVREDSISELTTQKPKAQHPEPVNVFAVADRAIEQPHRGFKLARLGKMPEWAPEDDNDEDLEIVGRLPPHLRMFEKVAGNVKSGRPADSKALHALKHLSNTHANDAPRRNKRGEHKSIDPTVLEAQLRRRAKVQAREQQLERIEELKAKGITVQTAEEREKDAEAFEDLLEKARQEAVELRRAERAAAEGGDEAGMEASDDEDEEYQYSGDEEDGDDDEGNVNDHEMIDGLADESEEEQEVDGSEEEDVAELEVDEQHDHANAENQDKELVDTGEEDALQTQPDAVNKPRNSRRRLIFDEDEDEATPARIEEQVVTTIAEAAEQPEDPFAAFNFGAAGPIDMLMSPSQAFKATMQTPTQATQDDSLNILRNMDATSTSPFPPTLPNFNVSCLEQTPKSIPAQSQVVDSEQAIDWETPAPKTPAQRGLKRDASVLSESVGWEPTQDNGLPSPWTSNPATRSANLAAVIPEEYNTQSTVRMRVSESPVAIQERPRTRRLQRRAIVTADDSDDDSGTAIPLEKKDVFREMAKKRREALTEAERREAEKEMQGMMDEQAEESEDEYAGIGGDDYIAPETEQDREMIDSSHVDVDERQLAAHFAERERAREEAETSRLYKDLTTGVLRRKMGANAFDLEEDEDDLAARRRQMRQREEARKRKALLKDENIASLADGKQSRGKDAFLKAIADDGMDDDMGDGSDVGEEESIDASQVASQLSQTTQPLRETSGNKRRATELEDTAAHDRPPAKQRRTAASVFRRPTSLMEVQESVSFLLEEPNEVAMFGPTALEVQSDSESEYGGEEALHALSDEEAIAEEELRQNDGGFAPEPEVQSMPPPPRPPAAQRRTPATHVDRFSLKQSSRSNSVDSAHSRTAWAAGQGTGGFKVPSLLRRATTSAALSGANERGVTTSNGASLSRENSGGVRMGGSKKSSLAYQARAQERRATSEAIARRREENTRKVAALRRTASAAGLLGSQFGGKFE